MDLMNSIRAVFNPESLYIVTNWATEHPFVAAFSTVTVVGITALSLFGRSKSSSMCPDCVSGYLTKGTPTGKLINFNGITSYFARPDAGTTQSAVVILTDVFGCTLLNTQLIADTIAKETGFLCVIPDLFNGDPVSGNLTLFDTDPSNFFEKISWIIQLLFAMTKFLPWMYRHKHSKKLPMIHSFLKSLRDKENIKKVGVIGYCYGGKLAIALAGEKDKIDAYVVAHPSSLSIPADIEAIQKPGLYLCAEDDMMFNLSAKATTEKILKRKNIKAEFQLYHGTKHGFAIRGRESDPVVCEAKKAALQEAIQFFKEELNDQ